MRRIILAVGGAALLAALVAAIRRRSREGVPTRPLLVSESVVIERPQGEVYAYVSDSNNLPEWSERIRGCERRHRGHLKRAIASPSTSGSWAAGTSSPSRFPPTSRPGAM